MITTTDPCDGVPMAQQRFVQILSFMVATCSAMLMFCATSMAHVRQNFPEKSGQARILNIDQLKTEFLQERKKSFCQGSSTSYTCDQVSTWFVSLQLEFIFLGNTYSKTILFPLGQDKMIAFHNLDLIKQKSTIPIFYRENNPAKFYISSGRVTNSMIMMCALLGFALLIFAKKLWKNKCSDMALLTAVCLCI